MIKDLIIEHQGILLSTVVFLAMTAVAYFAIIKGKAELPPQMGPFPAPEDVEKKEKVLRDSRFLEKKASRVHKDVNRFGRWMLKFADSRKKVTVGFLNNVLLENPSVKTYREIK